MGRLATLLLLVGCAPSGTLYSLDISAPAMMSMTSANGAHVITGDVTHGAMQLELFYVASTRGDDDPEMPAPARLSLLTPLVSSDIDSAADSAHLLFRAPGVACADSAWYGSISWIKPMPNYELVIDARCVSGSDRIAGVLSGSL